MFEVNKCFSNVLSRPFFHETLIGFSNVTASTVLLRVFLELSLNQTEAINLTNFLGRKMRCLND